MEMLICQNAEAVAVATYVRLSRRNVQDRQE